MRLAIRDDDTNFFTTPEELHQVYHHIWNWLPPSLCVISQIKGKWNYWVPLIYKTKGNINWAAWQQDNDIYPIEAHKNLVEFLKESRKNGLLDICFHAIHHRNDDPQPPNDIPQNYVQGAEFYTVSDKTDEIRKEIQYLNNLFNTDISVFTPPQNLLSYKGYQAVIKNKLSICGGGIAFYQKEKNVRGCRNLIRQGLFKIRFPQMDFPYVLHFQNHNEIPIHYPLQPGTRLDWLKSKFDHVRRHEGDFVLSTHYSEMNYSMEYDSSRTMKNILDEFLDYTLRFRVSYVSLSELLASEKKQPTKLLSCF